MGYIQKEPSGKAGELRFLGSTNTQTRRLGYLVAILNILKSSYLPEEALIRRLVRWSRNHTQSLNEYVTSKGVIETRKSAERYIKLARMMGLVGEINSYLRPTETGRLISLAQVAENPFSLYEASIYLYYQIFSLDADYLIPSLTLAHKCESQSQIIEFGQDALLNHLSNRISGLDFNVTEEVRKRVDAVQSWTKPGAYSEHIFIPRIHWLIDLGLVKIKGKSTRTAEYELTELGRRVNEIAEGSEINQFWCQNTLFTVWGRGSEQRALWSELPEAGQRTVMRTYLERAFRKLKTSSHQRISASQFILYCTSNINHNLNIRCGFDDVKSGVHYIEETGDLGISFYWSESASKGYITMV